MWRRTSRAAVSRPGDLTVKTNCLTLRKVLCKYKKKKHYSLCHAQKGTFEIDNLKKKSCKIQTEKYFFISPPTGSDIALCTNYLNLKNCR